MTKKKFHAEAKAFVRKVIRTRKYLIKKGANHVASAPGIVDKLDRQLNFFPYNQNETMARFIQNYRQDISDIIPGGKCKAGFTDQFSELVSESNNILQTNGPLC